MIKTIRPCTYSWKILWPIRFCNSLSTTLFFTKEKVSIDSGATWVEPRTEGGRFIWGQAWYSSTQLIALFEWQPDIGFLFLSNTDLSTISTIRTSNGTTHSDLCNALMKTSSFVGIVPKGTSTCLSGFNLVLDTHHWNVGTDLNTVSSMDIGSSYEYAATSAQWNLIEGKSVLFAGAVNSVASDLMMFAPQGGTFVKQTMLVYNGAGVAYAHIGMEEISDVVIAHSGISNPHAFFISKENKKLGYHYMSYFYSLALATAVSLNIGEYHPSWDDEEFKYAVQTANQGYIIYTDKAKYTSDGNGPNHTWTRTESWGGVESGEAPITDTYGLSGDKYVETLNYDSTNWKGTIFPTVALTRDSEGLRVLTSSLGGVMENTLPLAAIEVPRVDATINPVEVSGILLSGGDNLIVVGNVDINLTIMSVEQ